MRAQPEEDNLQNLHIELIIIETRRALRAIGEYISVLGDHDRFRNILREEWNAVSDDVATFIDK